MKKILLTCLALSALTFQSNVMAESIAKVTFRLGDVGFNIGSFSIVKNNIVYASVSVKAGSEGTINLNENQLPHDVENQYTLCFSGSSLVTTNGLTTSPMNVEPCACQTTKQYQLYGDQSVFLDKSNVDGDWHGPGCITQP